MGWRYLFRPHFWPITGHGLLGCSLGSEVSLSSRGRSPCISPSILLEARSSTEKSRGRSNPGWQVQSWLPSSRRPPPPAPASARHLGKRCGCTVSTRVLPETRGGWRRLRGAGANPETETRTRTSHSTAGSAADSLQRLCQNPGRGCPCRFPASNGG